MLSLFLNMAAGCEQSEEEEGEVGEVDEQCGVYGKQD